MRAELTGDDAGLAKLLRALDAQASGALNRNILERVAPTLSRLVRGGFDASRGPRGPRWRKLKRPRRPGTPSVGGPLVASGELRDQASRVIVESGGLLIDVSREGALVHLYGSRGGSTTQGRDERGRFQSVVRGTPARQFLPLAPALPRRWQSLVNDLATQLWRSLYLR